MEFGFATFAAVFLLFAAASCAPAGLSLQDGCEDLRQSSMELNLIAKNVSAAVSRFNLFIFFYLKVNMFGNMQVKYKLKIFHTASGIFLVTKMMFCMLSSFY